MYSRRCEFIENSRARAHILLSPQYSSLRISPCCLRCPTSDHFRHETSYSICRRQPGSLTTSNATLCYHLPRVYQPTSEQLIRACRARCAYHRVIGKRCGGSKSGCGLLYYCEEDGCIKSSKVRLSGNHEYTTENKTRQQRVKPRPRKTAGISISL